jgi:hypothetical protein
MAIRQRDAEHGPRQHLGDVSGQFNWLFFGHS